MPHISRAVIAETVAAAPSVEVLDADWLSGNPPTIYICAQGFEDRYDAVASEIAKVRPRSSVVLTLNSNSAKDRENGQKLAALLNKASSTETRFVNADDPQFHSRLDEAIGIDAAHIEEAEHVIVDLSVAANRICLRTLAHFLPCACRLTVAYTEAMAYHPEQEEFSTNLDAWIADDRLGTEKGVETISPCEEFPGEHLDAASNVIVLLPNFRHERSAATISHVDPALLVEGGDDVIWLLGKPRLEKDMWRRDAMRTLNKIGENAKVFEASTFDYREAWRVLEAVYDERWETANITLSPLGSKLQALAVTLFCMHHSDVRVLLSVPQQYNTKQWSEGVRQLWRVSFDCAKDFLSEIRSAGSLKLEGFDF